MFQSAVAKYAAEFAKPFRSNDDPIAVALIDGAHVDCPEPARTEATTETCYFCGGGVVLAERGRPVDCNRCVVHRECLDYMTRRANWPAPFCVNLDYSCSMRGPYPDRAAVDLKRDVRRAAVLLGRYRKRYWTEGSVDVVVAAESRHWIGSMLGPSYACVQTETGVRVSRPLDAVSRAALAAREAVSELPSVVAWVAAERSESVAAATLRPRAEVDVRRVVGEAADAAMAMLVAH